MKLRVKYTLRLLVLCVIPLVIVSSIGQRHMLQAGEEISEFISERITERLQRELTRSATHYTETLQLQEALYVLALNMLWDNAWFNLHAPMEDIYALGGDARPAHHFDDPDKAPKDMIIPPCAKYLDPTGEKNFQKASFGTSVLYYAPGVDENAHIELSARLKAMTPNFIDISKTTTSPPFKMYFSTEEGVHVSYPGHGGYPEGYDPRKREWYIKANAADRTTWTGPMVDATTLEVVFTMSRGLFTDDGKKLGVVAMDIPLEFMINEKTVSRRWTKQTRCIFTTITENPKTEDLGILMIAQRDYGKEATSWNTPIEYQWLTSQDTDKFDKFVEMLHTQRRGAISMEYNGVPSLWAFSIYDEQVELSHMSAMILITPQTVISELANKTSALIMAHTDSQLVSAGAAITLVMVIVTFAAIYFSRRSAQAMERLSGAAKALGEGNFDIRIRERFNDERDQVVHALNEMGPKLKELVGIRNALEVAREVQERLLPQSMPCLPGFDIAGKSVYCDETGGDYFDFVKVRDDDAEVRGILVGDVTGHGVPSALLMATARALLRGMSSMPGTLGERITLVNKMLSEDLFGTGRFMTLFFLELDIVGNSVSWVRAGHDPAIYYNPDTDDFSELGGDGIPLGVAGEFEYATYDAPFSAPGGILLIGTDGIWEARNAKNEMFGKERLHQLIRENAGKTSEEIIQAVLRAVDDFQIEQEDDITIAVVKRV